MGLSANLHFVVEKEFQAELHCRGKVTFGTNFSTTTVSVEQLVKKKREKKEELEKLSHLENTAFQRLHLLLTCSVIQDVRPLEPLLYMLFCYQNAMCSTTFGRGVQRSVPSRCYSGLNCQLESVQPSPGIPIAKIGKSVQSFLLYVHRESATE